MHRRIIHDDGSGEYGAFHVSKPCGYGDRCFTINKGTGRAVTYRVAGGNLAELAVLIEELLPERVKFARKFASVRQQSAEARGVASR